MEKDTQEEHDIEHITRYLAEYIGTKHNEIIDYLKESNKEYIPSILADLNNIFKNHDMDEIQTIAAFNMLLNEFSNKLTNESNFQKKYLYCVSYLFIYLYKITFMQTNQKCELTINDNIRQYITLLYNKIVCSKNANISSTLMLIEVLRHYVVIADSTLTHENSKVIMSLLPSPTNNDESLLIDFDHIIKNIYCITNLISVQNTLFKADASNLYNKLVGLQAHIIRKICENDTNYNHEYISQVIMLYINYKKKYIVQNDWFKDATSIKNFHDKEQTALTNLKRQAAENSKLNSYLILENKLHMVFKYYLESHIILKSHDINNRNEIVKLMSLYNKIAYIADNPIILQTLKIEQSRKQIIDDTINWILSTEFELDDSKALDIINKAKVISAWQQHLNNPELIYVLKFLSEWQAYPNLSGSSLKAILNCKLGLEMHYVDTLNFTQLMDYYQCISAETEKPPLHSRAILSKILTNNTRLKDYNITLVMPAPGAKTPEDKNRQLLFNHDSKLRRYAAETLDKLNPSWYASDFSEIEDSGAHPNVRAKNYNLDTDTTVEQIQYSYSPT